MLVHSQSSWFGELSLAQAHCLSEPTPHGPDFLAHILPPSALQLDLGSAVQCSNVGLSLYLHLSLDEGSLRILSAHTYSNKPTLPNSTLWACGAIFFQITSQGKGSSKEVMCYGKKEAALRVVLSHIAFIYRALGILPGHPWTS